MPDLNHFLDTFPEAAVLISQGKIVAANSMARHYLPQLELDFPLPLDQDPPAAGTFAAGSSNYSFSVSQSPEGLLLIFRPAAQTVLTDFQLDGSLRQMRSILAELLIDAGGQNPNDQAVFRKNFYRMFRLVDNLDCMRLASSPQGLSFHPISMDLGGLCAQIARDVAPLLRDGGINLDYQSTRPSMLIPGDPQLLQRLLLELISNSARVTGRGSIFVRLRSQGNRALLLLSDSGNSPTPRQIASMLQQDSDQHLPTPEAGAGIGLSIARHIAALHSGSLLVEWGQSSLTVVLSLPTGPLIPRATVFTPSIQRDGGLSPLLVALADVLPAQAFELAELD